MSLEWVSEGVNKIVDGCMQCACKSCMAYAFAKVKMICF